MSLWGRSDCIILRKMAESDRPNVLKTQAWALSDRPNRPPGGSRAFQMLRKAAHLPHGFATWQNRAPYGSECCPCLGMGSFFQKWCCGLHQMEVLASHGTKTTISDGHRTIRMVLWFPPPPRLCRRYAGAMQGLCSGYDNKTISHRHLPTATYRPQPISNIDDDA